MRSQYAHVRGARTDNQIVEAAAELSDADAAVQLIGLQTSVVLTCSVSLLD
jgi:hypothetical protein